MGLPSLTKICGQELLLDDVAQKKLRADAKDFRAACVAEHEGSGKVMSSKEMAMRYLTDGNEAIGIKPGASLWQTSRQNTDSPQLILPRDDEIVLRGVERVFEKMEQYARDKRKTHGRTTIDGGQTTGNDEEDDDFPDLPDLADVLSATKGRKKSVDQVPPHLICTASLREEAQPSSQTDQAPEPAWDADIPFPCDNRKDKEYEPSSRLTDEPTRLPTTRKEIERRKHLPPSQRSRESTLIPIEEAINHFAKRGRSQGVNPQKIRSRGRKFVTDGEDEEDAPTDTDSTGIQGPNSHWWRGKMENARSSVQKPASLVEGVHVAAFKQVTKKPRLRMSTRELMPSRPLSSNGPRALTDVTAAYVPFTNEIPDSPQVAEQDLVDGMPVVEEDDRSQTLVALPTSDRARVDDDGIPQSCTRGTRESSLSGEVTSQAEDSIELGSVVGRYQAHASQHSAADEAHDEPSEDMSWREPQPDPPPNVWILTTKTPTLSWMWWNEASLDAMSLGIMTEVVKRHMQLDQLRQMKIIFADRSQEWLIVLRSDDEWRYQDIKAMLMAKTDVRDIWFSPVLLPPRSLR
ncbi:MAG: hypothetical protein Q9186_002402 [Xanthomendoza sp. 1 TL-2023]